MAKAHRDYQGLFCYIGLTVFTALMILTALRLSHVDRFSISDAGLFIVCIAAILLILSVRITERWNTRGEIIAATALGIIPAVIYPIGIWMILTGLDASEDVTIAITTAFCIGWLVIAISAIRRCRTALRALLSLQKLEIRNKALSDIRNAEMSGAENTDERIALALIAAEKDLSDKQELLTEYRRPLAEHAMLSGRPGSYFVEIAEELINNDRINF